ncbi:COX15/CtaA family protein [Streptomyces sp. DSM 40750]|uniref:COX15/CtaA family protein n=1 Tax=Streptomyces sp. DSM 40750 TaxID=2801030 RepID=UPI003FA73F42
MAARPRLVQASRRCAGWRCPSLWLNIVLLVSGGVVRLTDSGLGCPTWPRCSAPRRTAAVASPAIRPGARCTGARSLTVCDGVVVVRNSPTADGIARSEPCNRTGRTPDRSGVIATIRLGRVSAELRSAVSTVRNREVTGSCMVFPWRMLRSAEESA